MLLIIAIVLTFYACLVQKATCFCPTNGHKKFTPHCQHRQNKPSTSHQLALSSQDKVLHGRYNTIITTTNHLLSNSNNNTRWIGSLDPSLTRRSNSSSSQAISLHPINNNNSLPPPPIEAIHAIEATYRWATNFVRGLNLCPWAGASIDNPGAICYWVLLIDEDDDRQEEQVDVLHKMEEIIREAGVQLTLATTETTNSDDDGHLTIDPSVAISFIILVPKTAVAGKEETTNNYYMPSFENFHEFFLDLEDRLLDECDDYWNSIDTENEETGEHFDDDNNVNSSLLGCDITIAAFHPEWQFIGSEEDGESDDDDDNNIIVHPIDYEKRTPYPTISIVMSSVIDSLMKEREGDTNNGDSSSSAPVTERIADLNEKTLCAIGAKRLKEIFDKDVLECPGRDAQ